MHRFALILLLHPLWLFTQPAVGQTHHQWTYNQNVYEVNVRQYTSSGTFAEFATHLDRLQEMGVGILWFMPIHPIGIQNRLGTLGSYYSVRDYYDVNPEFGTIEEFVDLVAEIHNRGMYVMMDWVGNHTAWDNGLTLTHPEWYVMDEDSNFVSPPGTNWTDVIQLDYSRQGLRDYMIDAMKWWVDTADIDGFRFDAVSFMPDDFWQPAFDSLKAVKPELLMLAEYDDPQLFDLGFDMSMGWGLHGFGDGILRQIYAGGSTVSDLYVYLLNELNTYPPDQYRMYFTSNHDNNSWFGTDFELFGDAAEVFAVLTLTVNSMPQVYSGQEAGLDHRLLFFDKDEIIWRPHAFAFVYSTLLNLKKENRALWNGTEGGRFERVETTADHVLFAYVRESGSDRVLVLMNLSSGYNGGTLLGDNYQGEYTDVFSGESLYLDDGAQIVLPGWGYQVLATPVTSTVGELPAVPTRTELHPAFPNPFNPVTTIRFELPESETSTLKVFNMLGEEVTTLITGRQDAGNHTVLWNATGYPSGVYLYRLEAGGFVETRKLILLK